MAKNDKDIGAPMTASHMLRGANGGLVVVILGLYFAEFGFIPADVAFPLLQSLFQVFYWSGIVLLMIWSWRATKYLEDVSAHDLTNSPAMAGFAYIIPILSLWKPYESVRDIFKASRNPDGWTSDKKASLIGWWWACLLAANLGGITLRFIPEEAFSQGMTDGQYAHLALVRLALLAGIVLQMVIVSRVIGWFAQKPTPAAAEVF